jgi:hypothetical protein
MEKYRQGLDPQRFAHDAQPKKKIRGWGVVPCLFSIFFSFLPLIHYCLAVVKDKLTFVANVQAWSSCAERTADTVAKTKVKKKCCQFSFALTCCVWYTAARERDDDHWILNGGHRQHVAGEWRRLLLTSAKRRAISALMRFARATLLLGIALRHRFAPFAVWQAVDFAANKLFCELQVWGWGTKATIDCEFII